MPGGHLLLGDELDAADHDGREHHNGSTAQDSLGHDGDQSTQLGDQAAQDQKDGTGGQSHPVDHLSHGHQTHILAEGGVGQHAEQSGKGGAQTVANDAAGQLLVRGLTAHAALHNARDIAYGLHSGDDEHDQHRQDGTHIEHDLYGHELGHGKPGGVSYLAPVQHPCLGELHAIGSDTGGGQHKAHQEGGSITSQDADEDSRRTEEASGPVLEDQDDHQHEQSQQQVFHGAEVLGLVAAAKGVDAHGDQRQTDGKHHGTRDHRGEELPQGLQEKAQHALKNAADDRGTHDGTVGQHTAAHGAYHTVEHPDKTGAGTHDDGHAAAHGADREQLHQRDHTSHEHGALQQGDLQVCKFTTGNAAGTGDDQQRGQVAHEHGADMLQAQGDGLAQRHLAIKLVSSLFKFDFLQMFHSPQNLDVLGFGCFAKSGFIITKLLFNVN